jgi:hypothetical protein
LLCEVGALVVAGAKKHRRRRQRVTVLKDNPFELAVASFQPFDWFFPDANFVALETFPVFGCQLRGAVGAEDHVPAP